MEKQIRRASMIVIVIIILAQGIILFNRVNSISIEQRCPNGYETVTKVYTIKPGDSLWSICGELHKKYPAMRLVSTKYLVDTTKKMNPGMVSYETIREGDTIVLPAWIHKFNDDRDGAHVGVIIYHH